MVKRGNTSQGKPHLSLVLCCEKKIVAPSGWFVNAKKIINRLFLKFREVEINVVLVSPTTIKKLNQRYRRENKITDVLSFTYANKKPYLQGDVLICLAVARQQALSLGHSCQEELNALLVHGVLHLLGLDHRSAREKKTMMMVESKLLGSARRLVS